MIRKHIVIGVLLVLVGLIGLVWKPEASDKLTTMVGGGLMVFGTCLLFGRIPGRIHISAAGIDLDLEQMVIKPKVLPEAVKREREKSIAIERLPAADAPAFNAVTDMPDMSAFPGADPMTPMYLLDKNFRILDWNEALALAFDRSMEGHRGQGAMKWIYILDNYKAVADHGIEVFSDPENLPAFDMEELQYTSNRYGRLQAVKRAYRLPNDQGAYAGWLLLLDVSMQDPQQQRRFRFDLLRTMSATLTWTEYALSYDQVLSPTALYQDLINKMAGEDGVLGQIPPKARILDLGAGTGNVTRRLAQQGRIVFALENNRTMLKLLREKCKDAPLRRDNAGPGVIAIKQDVHSLFGLPHDYFDLVTASNVLYMLDQPLHCLKEVFRVLRPGGQVRLSGPARGFRLDKLFKYIRADLKRAGRLPALEDHFERARRINSRLEPELRRWSKMNLDELLKSAGFGGVQQKASFYKGHGTIVASSKP